MSDQYLGKLKQYLQTLGDLSDYSWSELERIFSIKKIYKDDFFYNNQDKKIGFVLDGIFRKYILTDEGFENNLQFITSNCLMCSSMENQDRSALYIQSLGDSIVLEADYDIFKDITSKHKDVENIHKSFLFLVIQSNQTRENILLSYTGKAKYLQFVDDYEDLLNKIPHYHIASYLGITPTQLSRIRKNY